MPEAVILSWFAIVSIIGLNGFAAGLAAILYLWRRSLRRGSRATIAAAVSGFLPATIFIPMALTDREFVAGDGIMIAAVGFTTFWAVAMAVSLPGALIVARKLEAPGDDFRAFE